MRWSILVGMANMLKSVSNKQTTLPWVGGPGSSQALPTLPCRTWSFCVKSVSINRGELQIWGTLGLPLKRGLGWPPKTSPLPLYMCYHVKFGFSALKGVCINRREPPPPPTPVKERWGHTPLRWGVADHVEIRPFPTCVLMPNLVVSGQAIRALLRKSTWKFWPLCVPPFRVTQDHRNRHRLISCYRSIAIMSLFRTVSVINVDFSRKICTIRVFNTPADADGVPLELGTALGLKKTRMMWLPDWERCLSMSFAIWIQYKCVTERDRRTDEHLPIASTALKHSITRYKISQLTVITLPHYLHIKVRSIWANQSHSEWVYLQCST